MTRVISARIPKSDRDRLSLLRQLKRARTPTDTQRALVKVLAQYQALAFAYARRWRADSLDPEDLRQEAVLWLLDAAMRYDETKGGFTSFALWRMRYGLSEFVKRKSSVVYVPGNVLRDEFTVRRQSKSLSAKLGREPTEPELAQALGWTDRRVANVAIVSAGFSSASEDALVNASDAWLTTWMSDDESCTEGPDLIEGDP